MQILELTIFPTGHINFLYSCYWTEMEAHLGEYYQKEIDIICIREGSLHCPQLHASKHQSNTRRIRKWFIIETLLVWPGLFERWKKLSMYKSLSSGWQKWEFVLLTRSVIQLPTLSANFCTRSEISPPLLLLSLPWCFFLFPFKSK